MKHVLFRIKKDVGREFTKALVVKESKDFIELDYALWPKWFKKDELEIAPYPEN